jgi:hypothetical protein
MKVSELITELKKLEPTDTVMVLSAEGYEESIKRVVADDEAVDDDENHIVWLECDGE